MRPPAGRSSIAGVARPVAGRRPDREARMRRGTLCELAAALCLLVLAAPAAAAAPSNDDRTSPQPLSLPASVTGTTRQATLESDEPSSCENLRASVWYAVTAASADRIVVRVAAAGNL